MTCPINNSDFNKMNLDVAPHNEYQEQWHTRWATNRIGFHQVDVNPLLIQYWQHLTPKSEHTVLVPLCGKSEDLIWLAEKHESVTGVELSNIAVRSFFAEQLYTPTVTTLNSAQELYQFDELSIYAGDFFTAPLGEQAFDLIYDRAALIALPLTLRQRYVQRLKEVMTASAKILLITLDYPQDEKQGPPYSVSANEVATLFSDYKITLLGSNTLDHEQKKVSSMVEEVWLIES